jgi:hypothetical protein
MPEESLGTAPAQGSWFLPLGAKAQTQDIRIHSYPTLQQLLNIHWLSTPAVLGFTRPMRDHDTPSGVLRHCCSLQCKVCKRALDFKQQIAPHGGYKRSRNAAKIFRIQCVGIQQSKLMKMAQPIVRSLPRAREFLEGF